MFGNISLIHEAIMKRQVRAGKVAIQTESGNTITYEELDKRSNQLAHFLRECGVKRNELVGILHDRNEFLLVGIVGILKAGGAYLPLDPSYPDSRLRNIVNKAKPKLILTEKVSHEKLAGFNNQDGLDTIIVLDAHNQQTIAGKFTQFNAVYTWNEVNKMKTNDPIITNEPTDLACVLFTSGSTGEPKGVMVHHQGIMNCLNYAVERFALDEEERFILVSSMNFDMSLFELFAPLIVGGTSFIVSSETVRDPWKVLNILHENKITIWHSVPTLWSMWVNIVQPNSVTNLDDLRLVFLGGERLLPEYVNLFQSLYPETDIINVYGPTETTLWMSEGIVKEVDENERIPAGKPLPNVNVYIMDDSMNVLEQGEIGEIVIGGVSVTHGYLNDEEKTSEVFVKDVFSENDQLGRYMYKTGDIGRIHPDGNIDVIGRKDFQIKIRGYRVELGEIESTVIELSEVKQVAVISTMGENSHQIHCYVQKNEERLQEKQVRDYIVKKLPSYFTPHHIYFVDKLPLTPNGKIDRQVLKQWSRINAGEINDKLHLEKDLETTILGIWQEILGHKNFSTDESFFNIGGDSLKIVKMKMELDKIYPNIVQVTELFAYPTIKQLTEVLWKRIEQSNEHSQEYKEENTEKNRVHKELKETITTDKTIRKSINQESIVSKEKSQSIDSNNIAVIGYAFDFPGSNTAEQFWENLITKQNSVTEIPSERWNGSEFYSNNPMDKEKANSRWGGFIKDIDLFDANFFDISRKEAELMDPQQRLLLETVMKTLDHAGYGGDVLAGSETGVYIAGSYSDYLSELIEAGFYNETYMMSGNQANMLANRISYHFNLLGPSQFVDTACSSSLVAIHQACQDIRNGHAETAIVGSVSLNLNPLRYISLSKMRVLSPTGECRAFDENANGFVPGEGVGSILLKNAQKAIEDGDTIHCIINGSAVKHGGKAIGVTAPNPASQEAVIRKAYQNTNISPYSVSYIEAHGTGTPLGDPIEMKALSQIWSKDSEEMGNRSIPVGSVKSMIGHLGETAGMASLIKVILAMKHKQIPPTLHYQSPNPELDIDQTPFMVNQDCIDWDPNEGIRRAGISSFGMGGTNVHLIVEEPMTIVKKELSQSERSNLYLATLSAKSEYSLQQRVSDLHHYLLNHPEISMEDACYTLNVGRGNYRYRIALVFHSYQELLIKLNQLNTIRFSELHTINDREGFYFNEISFTTDNNIPVVKNIPHKWDLDRKYHDLANQYVNGEVVDWKVIHDENCRRIEVPVYPFDRKRYWYKLGEAQTLSNGQEHDSISNREEVSERREINDVIPAQLQTNHSKFNDGIPTHQEIEEFIIEAIYNVLTDKTLDFNIDTDFFDIDIDSLAAVELTNAVGNFAHVPIQPKDIFENPTIHELSNFIIDKVRANEIDTVHSNPLNKQIDDENLSIDENNHSNTEHKKNKMITLIEIEQFIQEAIYNVLTDDSIEIDLNTDFFEIDIDSLAAIELTNAIGKFVNVPIQPQDIFEYSTIKKLSNFIINKIEGVYSAETI